MHKEKTNPFFEWCYNDFSTKKLKIIQPSHNSHPKNYYTLRYFYNPNKTFFHLFMHTRVYDKITNENIEKQGILLRSWNPITKRGQRYVFRKGEEGDGDLNLQRIYLPNTKTIFEFSTVDSINEESYCKLAEEIIKECPHKDIELKLPII
jgi:hypothetical protein